MSTPLQILIYGVLLPAVVAGIVLLLGRRSWAAALGIGAGYAAGHALQFDWPSLPPAEATNWPVYFAIGAAILAIVETTWEPRALLRWLARAVIGGVAFWLLRPPDQGVTWIGVALGAMLAFWALLSLLSRRLGDASLSLVLVVTLAGASALFGLTNSVSLARMGGCLTSAVGACWVLSAIGVGREIARGVVPVVSIVFASIAACSIDKWSYSGTPLWMAAVVAASPAAAWLVELTPIKSAASWKAAVARAIVVGIVVAVPVGLASKEFLASAY